MRAGFERTLLSVFVIIVGIVIGGGLYESLVIVPLWSGGPPDSLAAFNAQALKPDAGPRFWMFATPLMALVGVINLIMALRSRGERRAWWVAGSAGIVGIVIATFVFFVPLLMEIFAVGVGGDPVPAESIELWVTLNWVRALLLIASWACLLRAFGGVGATTLTREPQREVAVASV